ncbi:CAMK/CAMKL/AMPK protein kinase [Salpingoeca rosetta]|uniref:non-specific serine/threonine protein kinase n=1 Tax=Salpingoeca rosetta (strain ATCC 50818 / BSB-021) TaxID=946362 RepID=F2UNN9_SALR5|nr:CAMK/CAMKL/AMPK protein kinase [Salpingoeca rosetta]EGD79244.1 CAMK/CAMKL/AMPK protein kinase [Salpingoeca rosetta]|eukprot:XP_004989329.1 CAMK/CAMKL/AMPK protein kinase [Salpingoeca rosetta]
MTTVKRIGQYVLGDTLGKGAFGKVKKAEHAITKHVVAVKILNREKVKRQDMVGKIKREIQILKLFRHPNIIRLYQVISTPKDIFMIMEFVSGGELFDYIRQKGRLSEDESRKFFQQIISGVEYCHRHMVVHRDLKPENLLLDDDHNVKIADFGLSNIMTDGDLLKTSCGSPNYASPEVISGKYYVGPEVDVWSCGVILYVLLCGKLPFHDTYVPRLFKKIMRGEYEQPEHVSPLALDLLVRMLVTDPMQRITIDDIKKHPWFVVNMPEDLFVEDAKYEDDFDNEIVEDICSKFQVYRDTVLDALIAGDETDQLVVAYRLLLNNKRFHDRRRERSREDLVGSNSSLVSDNGQKSSKAPILQLETNPARLQLPSTVRPRQSAVRRQKRSRWHLGMRSQNKPQDIMAEVYRTLRALNFQWKVITPYHVRCRCFNQVSGTMVKMSLRLYRADKYYLLDFQNLATEDDQPQPFWLPPDSSAQQTAPDTETAGVHTMEFFELCATVIAELGR